MNRGKIRVEIFIVASLAALLLLSAPVAANSWANESTPTSENLYGVENSVDDAFAVGTGGDVLRRADSGWMTITDTGPSGDSNSLFGIGVTDDKESVWFVGSSGAVGEYNVSTGNLNDYSGLNGLSTNNFNEVSVRGDSGNATVYIAGDSGKVYYSYDNGKNWNEVTPGSGAAINSIDFSGEMTGHIVDANNKVYETTDGAKSWTNIGISDADESLLDVDSNSVSNVWVSASSGVIYNYDGSTWQNTTVSEKVDLNGIEVDGGDGYAVGGNGSVYAASSGSFSIEQTNTTDTLRSVTSTSPDISVGNSGTAIVRSSGGGGGNSAPTASFTFSPSSPEEGETVTFDGSGSSDSDGSIQSYDWDFGDGSSGTGESTTYSYSSSGDYDVTLTVTDDDGATDSTTQTVSVSSSGGGGGNAAPTASFTFSPSSPNVGETVTFDASLSFDSDGSIQSYDWDFDGDGTTDSTTQTPTTSNSYSSSGDYDVTLTVTDDDGASASVTQTVSVDSSITVPGSVNVSQNVWDAVTDSNGNFGQSEILDALDDYVNQNDVPGLGRQLTQSEILELLDYYVNVVSSP